MTNKRIGSKIAPYMRTDTSALMHSNNIQVGIVKNNIDPSRSGRLQVYIPQHGGPENSPESWITVSYACPFAGQTRNTVDVTSYVDQVIDINNEYENSFQSYGFWFVPPDINGRVLVVFANGDPSQGFWFACIRDGMTSRMVPSIGAAKASNGLGDGGYIWRPTGANAIATHTMLQSYIELNGSEIPFRLPVSEPCLEAQANSSPSTPLSVQMVPQVYQTRQLGKQGLCFDFLRGSTSASSVRETPSQVFGISTPGRLTSFANVEMSGKVISQIKDFLNSNQTEIVDNQQDNQNALSKALTCTYRTGGHTFVMDDGTVDGYDQGIRIRTTNGNQILLDDTNGQIYIINSQGTGWIELSPSGYIDIFSTKDFSVRSQGDINFHADKDINMNANGKIQMHSENTIQLDCQKDFTTRTAGELTLYSTDNIQIGSKGTLAIDTQGDTNLQSKGKVNIKGTLINLNSGGGENVKDPGKLPLNKQVDVIQKPSPSKVWWSDGKINSICGRTPTHEPWPNHEINGIKTTSVPQGNNSISPVIRPQTNSTSSGVRGTPKGKSINEADIVKQPVLGPLCGLTIKETQALLAQIGKQESGGNYAAHNTIGYQGKYQFGYQKLIDCGYIKQGVTGTNLNVTNNSANWTGLNGVNSVQDWYNNPSAQEQAMMLSMKSNCKWLQKHRVLNSSSTPEQIGGYLCVSHLLGPGGAENYFKLQNNLPQNTNYLSQDAYGTKPQSVFVAGSNAVQLATTA